MGDNRLYCGCVTQRTLQRVAGLGLLLGLVGCSGGGDGNPVFETDGCTKTRMEFSLPDPVAGKPTDLRFKARLVTTKGAPVPGQRVDFSVRAAPKMSADILTTGETDTQGNVSVNDAYTRLLPGGTRVESLRSATRLVASYRNPNNFNAEADPNYCSSNTEVDFRYTGPLP